MSPTPQTPPTDRPLTAGDWIEWHGGENPVPGQEVEIKWGDGSITKEPPQFDFQTDPDDGIGWKIIAYRISRPATSAASEGGKFRKRPVVIDAFEMRPEIYGDRSAWPQWLEDAWNLERGKEGSIQNYGVNALRDGPLQIVTLEGLHNVQVGDWIIRGVKGELYPCKPDVFALTYEPAALASPPVSERERELAVLLDNLVIAQSLSRELRTAATDQARSYLYSYRHPTAQPAGEGK